MSFLNRNGRIPPALLESNLNVNTVTFGTGGAFNPNLPTGEGFGIYKGGQLLADVNDSGQLNLTGLNSQVQLNTIVDPSGNLPADYRLSNGGVTGGGIVRNRLQLFTYDNGSFSTKLFECTEPKYGVQGLMSFTSTNQTGIATIDISSQYVDVSNSQVIAGSLILATPRAVDANAVSVVVPSITPGVSFRIHSNAPTSAPLPVQWFVVSQ